MQVSEKVISQGKNIGKKNETTPVQQATSEARASWIKMKESGYSEAIKEEVDNAASVRGKGIAADVPLPMLAHEYQKRGKGFPFPQCFTQPKLDGTRCVGIPGRGLFSRLRKTIPHMEHILAELNRIPSHLILDGELYTNELTFQEIVGLVKKETLKVGDLEKQLKIKYHVYDIIDSTMTYEERLQELSSLWLTHTFEHIYMVPTHRCGSEAEMKTQHGIFVQQGYEGIMLRASKGLYKNVRSVDLLKYKEFFDDEYEVVGFKEGEGGEKGCVLWTCKTEKGDIFHCRPRGTHEERAELYQKGAAYIGKKLTVRFQELTDDGIPRCPVGIAFRDYE
jgi:DNA ligase-1